MPPLLHLNILNLLADQILINLSNTLNDDDECLITELFSQMFYQTNSLLLSLVQSQHNLITYNNTWNMIFIACLLQKV
jgi:hypothetical protein